MYEKFKQEVSRLINEGIDEKTFNRTKNKIYGRLITSYNDASQIARAFMRDYMNNIVSFDGIEKWKKINVNDANEMLRNKFKEDKMILSVIEPKN